MMRSLSAFALALAALTPAAPALAQSPLVPVAIGVTRYDTLPELRPDYGMACCAMPVLESGPDQDFYYIDMDFNVAWSDDLDRVSVTGRDILLHFEGGDEDGQRAFGRVNYLPVVEQSGVSISSRRSRDWPDETTQAFLNGLWAVPTGTTTATLSIGEEGERIDIVLNLDVPVSQMISPLETLAVSLNGLAVEESMSRDRRITGAEFTITMQPTIGRLLRLDVEMTPRMSTETDNDVGEGSFFFYNNYFALIGPDGIPLAPIGQDVGGSLANDHSNSMSWDDEPSTIERGLYFLGAGTPGTYQVYYLSDLVGEIALQ